MPSWVKSTFLFAVGALLSVLSPAAKPSCVDHLVGGNTYTYRVCLPESPKANGSLVVYAHGYVEPSGVTPVPIPDQLVLDKTSVPDLVTNLGFAFATTSYPKTGLAIKEGIEDVKNLVDFFKLTYGVPRRVYLAGVSEGGLVTARAIEKYGASTFNGGLALCGPVGNFRKQINHFDDFRVVFDYFFPGVLPPSAVDVPGIVRENWDPTYVTAIETAIADNPGKLAQLISVTGVPTDPARPADAVLGVLWYNVFATNEARVELNHGPYTGNQGQPFDNRTRWYLGSSNDFRLNLFVKRYAADPAALAEMDKYYLTTGKLPAPLVTMHTTGDPIVPYWQESIYWLKVLSTGSLGNYLHLPVFRYGHCAFTPNEVLFGFALLVAMAH